MCGTQQREIREKDTIEIQWTFSKWFTHFAFSDASFTNLVSPIEPVAFHNANKNHPSVCCLQPFGP